MNEPNYLELARQGDPKSIAAWLNSSLKAKGVSTRVALKSDCLHIVLESSQAPEQKSSVTTVRKEMIKLEIKSIAKLKIYGRQIGVQSPEWTQDVEIEYVQSVQTIETKIEFQPAPKFYSVGKVPMDFLEDIRKVSERVMNLKDSVKGNEQATKSALILPFIQALGYDVFNPLEVYPEFGADVPEVKGDKVDYAIRKDGLPIIFIECKSAEENLDKPQHISQLFKYFNATHAKFGILTNGIVYKFYTDIVKENIMDAKAFFEFNMLDIQDSAVIELKKFSKTAFNPDELKNTASDLKYTNEIKRIIAEQLVNPSPEFVKFFLSYGTPDPLYSGLKTAAVISRFTEIIGRSFNQFISERITDRLKSALNVEDVNSSVVKQEDIPKASDTIDLVSDGVVTTQEELESFFIVKAILKDDIDPNRLQYKDTKSYFGVNLDGNTWKTVCRLWLNSSKKYIGFIDSENKETKFAIVNPNDIYNYASDLKTAVNRLTEK